MDKRATFKHIDLAQPVVLDEKYITENNQIKHLQAIAAHTIKNAKDESDRMLAEAREEARQTIELAKARAEEEALKHHEEVLKQGYMEGFEAGRQEGHDVIRQEMAEHVIAGYAMMDHAKTFEQDLILNQSKRLAQVMQTILKRLVVEAYQSDPSQLEKLLAQAAHKIRWSPGAKLKVHPEFLRELRALSPEVEEKMTQTYAFSFLADPMCHRHGIYLECLEGSFDLSPEEQLASYIAATEPVLSGLLESPVDDVVDNIDDVDETTAEEFEDVSEVLLETASIESVTAEEADADVLDS